jgi:hypothetical protein
MAPTTRTAPVTTATAAWTYARRSPRSLLPTPAVNDMGAAYTPETWDEWTATMKAKHNNGNGHGKSLNVEAQRLLPTPAARDSHNAGDPDRTADRMADRGQPLSEVAVNVLMPTPRATDGTKGGPNQRGSSGDLMLPSAVSSLLPTPTAQDSAQSGGGYNGQTNVTLTDATVRQPAKWGEYEPAIRRWEAVTRPAPEPTKPNARATPSSPTSSTNGSWATPPAGSPTYPA